MAVLKRLNAPDFWQMRKKEKKYIVSPSPGPHPKHACIPLGMLLRDYLGYARTMKEARFILNAGYVKVDGCTRKEKNFPVGLMDILSIGNERFVVLPGKSGFYLRKTGMNTKLAKIVKKMSIKKGRMQIGFHDGKNIITDMKDLKTGSVAVFDFVGRKITGVVEMNKGSRVIITSGKKMGHVGKVEKIIITRNSQENKVVVNFGGLKLMIPSSYTFAIPPDMDEIGE